MHLIFCVLFSCLLASKHITLFVLKVFFPSAYEGALGTLETGGYCSHAKTSFPELLELWIEVTINHLTEGKQLSVEARI